MSKLSNNNNLQGGNGFWDFNHKVRLPLLVIFVIFALVWLFIKSPAAQNYGLLGTLVFLILTLVSYILDSIAAKKGLV